MKPPSVSPISSLWLRELNDLICGSLGGFLFGIPLLYTMEVWWVGSFTKPWIRLGAIALTYAAVFLFNRTAGFRHYKKFPMSWLDTAMESIEAMAIGFICAAYILILLREINQTTPLTEILGKLVFEGLPFSLGVALARSFLRGDRDSSIAEQKTIKSPTSSQTSANFNDTLTDISATLIGATTVAFSLAPTDEIPMLAAATSPIWLIAIIISSLLISYGIVFIAGFINQNKRFQHRGWFENPLSETLLCYLVSLIASAIMLWFFQNLTFSDPWNEWLRHVLLLGLPATIGGAAGRLAV